jgi:hypothetical protein
MDMAVSYLSRLVLLQYLMPRLAHKSRVFIMGFPGSNQTNYKLDDLNAENGYEFGFVHSNTVNGNEALVLHWAKQKTNNTVGTYGLNPGLIRTGIRSHLYKQGVLKYVGPMLETMISWFGNSPASYAAVMVPLIFAESDVLDNISGSIFNPSAQVVFPSRHWTENEGLVSEFIEKSEALVKEKVGI